MPTTLIEVPTPDGPCALEVATPSGPGPWPAVIVFYDAAGLRPSQTRIAERIASFGYLTVIPNLFHRSPPVTDVIGDPPTLGALFKIFAEPTARAKFMAEYYMPALAYPSLEKTIGSVLDHLASRTDVTGHVGTTGYCMGGNASFRAATIFGSRIAATAAFHPGWLVTDQPDSPHLRSKNIKARLHLAPATGDLVAEAEAKLRAELDGAGVRYTIEHIEARHGYAVDDSPSHDVPSAEHHYEVLRQFYGETLRA